MMSVVFPPKICVALDSHNVSIERGRAPLFSMSSKEFKKYLIQAQYYTLACTNWIWQPEMLHHWGRLGRVTCGSTLPPLAHMWFFVCIYEPSHFLYTRLCLESLQCIYKSVKGASLAREWCQTFWGHLKHVGKDCRIQFIFFLNLFWTFIIMFLWWNLFLFSLFILSVIWYCS